MTGGGGWRPQAAGLASARPSSGRPGMDWLALPTNVQALCYTILEILGLHANGNANAQWITTSILNPAPICWQKTGIRRLASIDCGLHGIALVSSNH